MRCAVVDEIMIGILALGNKMLYSGFDRRRRRKFAGSSEEIRRVLKELNRSEVFHILLHSHYDPAWFARRSITRKMLGPFYEKVVKLLDSNGEYKFTADSQTQVIEDILTNFKGKKREKFRRKLSGYIASGRLVAGPYYAGIDLNLSSGAVLRRNIMYGLDDTRKLGWDGVHIGWMIDQFGFPSQMWQLHKKFGIDSIILWRGLGLKPDEAKAEILLESPDGSRILGKWLFVQGYRFGLYVGKYSDIGVPRLIQESEKIRKYTESSHLLIMDGYEGEDSPDDPGKVVRMMRSAGGKVEISTPRMFMAEMAREVAGADLPVVRGYQNYGYYSPVLKGIISARQYIKQAHQLCDSTLTKLVDPAAVFAGCFGIKYEKSRTDGMWRNLIRMASHDELGGCGIDDIHRDSLEVYRNLYSDSVSYFNDVFGKIAARVDTDFKEGCVPVVLFNTLTFDRSDSIRLKVALPAEWKSFVLSDSSGRRIETQLIGAEEGERDLIVKFDKDNPVPAFGYKTVFFAEDSEDGNPDKKDLSSMVSGDNRMENEYIRVDINENGTFDLTFKDTGRVWRGLGYIRVEPDSGDTYDFSHIENHEVITSLGVKAVCEFEYTGSLEVRCRISYAMMVPGSITSDRKSWSGKRKKLDVVLSVVLHRDSPRLDMDIQLDNGLKDSRIRICFPVETEVPDMFVNRQFEVYRMPFEGSWISAEEKKDIFRHMDGMISSGMDVVDTKTGINFKWVDIPYADGENSSSGEGLGIINRDNFEFEVRDEAERKKTVEFTLLRSVGWNARADLLTRNINAGWEIYTPDAFCYGRYGFLFSLLPHTGDWKNGKLLMETELRDTPVVSIGTERKKGSLASDYSMLRVETGTIVVSEITPSDVSGDELVFILYNPGEDTDSILFSFAADVVSAHISDLDGNSAVSVVSGGRDDFSLSLRKKEILKLTVKLEPVFSHGEKTVSESSGRIVSGRVPDSLDSALGLEMRPFVSLEEVEAEKKRWKECLGKYRRDLSSRKLRVPLSTLDDFINKYTEEEELINLENTVKEAKYSYLLTLKRYYETCGRHGAAERVEKNISKMGRQLIDLRVKKREAEIYRIFFENLKAGRREAEPEEAGSKLTVQ